MKTVTNASATTQKLVREDGPNLMRTDRIQDKNSFRDRDNQKLSGVTRVVVYITTAKGSDFKAAMNLNF